MPSVLDGLVIVKDADLKPDVRLQPHQQRVLKRLQQHPANLLLYHALGSGKSLTGIASAEQTGLPYTAVVPASLRANAYKELDKFVDESGRRKADVMSYTGLAQGKPVRNDQVLFFDEAARLRNPAALQTQRAMDLADRAKQVQLLTGTPIVNDPSDLAVPMSMLTGKRTTPKEFTERYVGKRKVNPGFLGWLRGVPPAFEPEIRNQNELKALLSGHVDYYAPQQSVVPTKYEDVPVEMSTDQARLYRAMWGQLPWVLRWKLQHDYPLSNEDLRRATSFLVGPRQVGLSTYPFMGDNKDPVKAFQSSTKLQEAYKRLTEKLKDQRTKAIVVSNFIDAGLTPYSAGLTANNIPHAMFHGGLSDVDRKKLVDDYNTGKIRVALLGPSGSEGLSLKGTQLVQQLDPYWNSARGRQFAGRALRYDSHWDLPEDLQNVTIQRFASKLPLGLVSRLKQHIGFDQEAKRRAADDYLANMAARKDRLNQPFINLLKEVGSEKVAQSWLPPGYTLQVERKGPRRAFTLLHDGKPVGGLRAAKGTGTHAIEEAYLNPEHRTPELGKALTSHIRQDHSGENVMLPDGGVIPVNALIDAYRVGGFGALPSIPEKQAADDRVVYSYVPRSALATVRKHGLLGGKALLGNQEALAAAAAGRGQTTEETIADLRRVLGSWKKYQGLGPNVMFQPPPAATKLAPNHPLNQRDLVPLRVQLDRLMRDVPKTRVYGMELEPYDPKKHYTGKERHHYIKPDALNQLLASTPEQIWANYKDPENKGYYAADVPHASIHTPDATIPSQYLEFPEEKQAADEMEQQAKNWVRHVMDTSFATYPPAGVFTLSPTEIADAGDQPGVAPKGLTSWQRMVLFHRNRGGRGLTDERRQALQNAVQMLSQRRTERRQKPELYDQDTLLPIKQGESKEGVAHAPPGTTDSQRAANRGAVLDMHRADRGGAAVAGTAHAERSGTPPLAAQATDLEKKALRFDSAESNLSAVGIPDRRVYGEPHVGLKPGSLVDYIVQEHLARRAGKHFDIRLGGPETGLFSWASRKGVPEPGQKRLAIQQPLHSHEYGKFEGTIRKGYGAGTVKKHDVGQALVTKIGPDGSIHFTLAHTRFPERFLMLPPKTPDQRNWLMLNVTKTKPVPYEKVRYTTVPPEKAEEVLGKLSPGSSVQQKIDGAASLVQLFRDHVEVLSYRKRKDTGGPIVHTERALGKRPEANIPKNLVGTVLRGELYGVRPTGKAIEPQEVGGILNSSVGRALRTQEAEGIKLRNMLFDVDRIGSGRTATDIRDRPYDQRMARVKEIMQHLPRQDVFHAPEEAKTPEDAIKMWRRIALGKDPLTEEGIVIHPPTGKPSKIKLRGEHDVYVREFFPGMGKYKDNAVGGFRYSHEPEGPIVGEVGTGITDALRRDMHQNPDLYTGRVARILSPRKLPSGALFAPALLGLHEDYSAANPPPPPAPKLLTS